MTERRGIGSVSAAQTIVSLSHPGRCRNDAAFAALAGASPLKASSGRTVRHRLNQGGDRALNRAIHTIAATQMRYCPTTQAYLSRRTLIPEMSARPGHNEISYLLFDAQQANNSAIFHLRLECRDIAFGLVLHCLMIGVVTECSACRLGGGSQCRVAKLPGQASCGHC